MNLKEKDIVKKFQVFHGNLFVTQYIHIIVLKCCHQILKKTVIQSKIKIKIFFLNLGKIQNLILQLWSDLRMDAQSECTFFFKYYNKTNWKWCAYIHLNTKACQSLRQYFQVLCRWANGKKFQIYRCVTNPPIFFLSVNLVFYIQRSVNSWKNIFY